MKKDVIKNPVKPRIILASGSPRRKEILEKMGLEFDVVPSIYEEDMTIPIAPVELVKHLALGKAQEVALKYPDAIVIGADTIVFLEGKVLGKPHTNDMAEKMLMSLSGKNHQVITGMVIMHKIGNVMISNSSVTGVTFKKLSSEQISAYIETGEPLDKAGAYAIQGLGGKLIEKIEGDYWGMVGLPAGVLAEHLKIFGISTTAL